MTKKEAKQFLYEALKAGKPGRLGITRSDVMEWLLCFAQKDLTKLSEGDIQNLAFEVAVFVQYGGRHTETSEEGPMAFSVTNWEGMAYSSINPLQGQCSPADLRRAFGVYQDAYALQPSLPSLEHIEVLQQHIHEAVIGSVDKNITFIRRPSTLHYLGRFPSSDYVQVATLTESPQDLFLLHWLDFLGTFIRKVARCPECSNIFLRERTNKNFCSLRCQTRVATRRARNTPEDRIGKRGRPKGSTQKTLEMKRAKTISGKKRRNP